MNLTTNMSSNVSFAVQEEAQSQLLYISRAIMFYGLSIIIPFGLVFNTLSVFVFMSRPMRKRSASWYLAALGVSDNISLLAVMLDYWVKDERIGLPVTKYSEVTCILVTYVSHFSRLYSSVIITSFTVERFIGVVFPLKRATLRTTVHVRKLLIIELPVCMLATSFTLVTIGIVDSEALGTECDIRAETAPIYGVFNVVVLILGSIVVPIIVICSLNIFMFRRIWLRRRNFPTDDNVALRYSSGGSTNSHHRKTTMSGMTSTTSSSIRTRSHYNTATLLLAVSSVFVILNAPYCITWLLLFCHYYEVFPLPNHMFNQLYAAKYITSVQYYLNYGSNFLVYNLVAKMFRVQFLRTCCCICRKLDIDPEVFRKLVSRGHQPPPPPPPSEGEYQYSTRSLERHISNGFCPTVRTLSKNACSYYTCQGRSHSSTGVAL